MPATVKGSYNPKLKRDKEGHREYEVTYLVRVSVVGEGPATVLTCPDLPQVGEFYTSLSDFDIYAWCHPDVEIEPVSEVEKEPCEWFLAKYKFSTKPIKKCKETQWEDPLLEPPVITVSSIQDKEEVTKDRFGDPIVNSAHELLKGAVIEFDKARTKIRIEQNYAQLDLNLFDRFVNCLNDAEMWGLPARCIRFCNYSATQKWHGQCYSYWTISMEFETYVRVERQEFVGDLIQNFGEVTVEMTLTSGWDRRIADEGSKVLNGKYDTDGTYIVVNINGDAPDPENPHHFIRHLDRNGNPCRVMLNGAGLPANTSIRSRYDDEAGTGSLTEEPEDPGFITIEYYEDADLFLLDIPVSLI